MYTISNHIISARYSVSILEWDIINHLVFNFLKKAVMHMAYTLPSCPHLIQPSWADHRLPASPSIHIKNMNSGMLQVKRNSRKELWKSWTKDTFKRSFQEKTIKENLICWEEKTHIEILEKKWVHSWKVVQ